MEESNGGLHRPKRPALAPSRSSRRSWEPWRWIHEAPRLDWESLAPSVLRHEDQVDRDRSGGTAGGNATHHGNTSTARHEGRGEKARAHKSKREQEQDDAMEHAREREREERPGWAEFIFTRHNWRKQARYTPLIAAVFAPLSTLLDIPGLSQHWYNLDDVPQPDPLASLVLSAVGLALNVAANALLILRFSSQSKWWWRHATTWSLIFWVGKTVVAAVNLILFGILTRDSSGYSYAEGFWCAVVSIIDAGIISIALLIHYFVTFRHHDDNNEVRAEGKRFMLSVTFFVAVLGLQALVFSRIEGWVYLDAIYFSVQVALTIGYGDFTPTTAAGKVLIFPFAILTISQLGNEISLILGFIQTRAEERRGRWRKRYEKAMHEEANKLRPKASLMEEMALIYQINKRENTMSQIYDLGWSAISLVVFWAVGAAVFSSIEGWSFGNGVYAVMILSFTIDYTPKQPATRVIFIVYALMAVPIVTSFAVQTITGLLSTYSRRTAMHDSFVRDRKDYPDAFRPHADFVLRAHESYGDMRKRLLGDYSPPEPPQIPSDDDEDDEENGADAEYGADGEYLEEAGSRGGSIRQHHEKAPTQNGENGEKHRPAARDSDGEVTVDLSSKRHPNGGSAPATPGAPSPQPSGSPARPDLFANSANPDLEALRKHQHIHKPPLGGIKVTKDLNNRKNVFFPQLDYGEGYNEREQKYREEYQRMVEIVSRRKERMKGAGHRGKAHFKDLKRMDPDDPNEPENPDDAESSRSGSSDASKANGNGQKAERGSGEGEGNDEMPGVAPSKSRTGAHQLEKRRRDGRRQRERLRNRHHQLNGDEDQDSHDWEDLQMDMTKQLMELTVRLEAEARQLLVDSMDPGVARTLLLADRNVQARDVKSLRGDDVDILKIWRGERDRDEEDVKRLGRNADEHGPAAMLNRVKRYRNTFAEVLVVGSILQELKGEEWGQFVRLNEKYRERRKQDQKIEELPEPFGPKKIFGGEKGKMEKKMEKFGRVLTV